MSGPTLRFAVRTDVGSVRRVNQDSGYAGPNLLVVADGVGGGARGDVASSVVVDTIRRLDVPPDAADTSDDDVLSRIAHAIHLAHDRIGELVEETPALEGTSTTLTMVLFDGSRMHVGHIGDSRAYLLRDGELLPLTTDHSLVQSLVDEGRITEEEARVHPHRNLILKAVDGVHEPEPDLSSLDVRPGDRLLLCSDGCSGVLDSAELIERMSGDDLEAIATILIRSALEAGSTDNITVVLADVVDDAGSGAEESQIVGAAAAHPELDLSEPPTGNITEEELAPLAEEAPDPEELRYAPRAPKRFTWLKVLAGILVVAIVVAGALVAFRDWTQRQYFVGTNAGEVVVYRGIPLEIPWVSPRSVVKRTGILTADLQEDFANNAEDGIRVDSIADGIRKAHELRLDCDGEGNEPSPTDTSTPDPTTPGTTTPGTPSPGTPSPGASTGDESPCGGTP